MTVKFPLREKRDSGNFIKSIGEHGLIQRIRNRFQTEDKSVILGIGDDAAVIKPSPGKLQLISTDTLRENIHFRKIYTSFYDIGWKAAAVSISDIAAMGGMPRYMLLSVAIPSRTKIGDIEDLLKAVSDITSSYGTSLIGGNISRSKGEISVDTTVIGEVKKNSFVGRYGAVKGDLIYVTGTLGKSAMGRELLESSSRIKISSSGDHRLSLTKKHLRPIPRIKEGNVIGSNRLAKAMIDISDGLMSDLGHICEQSNVGADIQSNFIPIPAIPKSIKRRFLNPPIDYALFGGEDYELLFTVRKKDRQKLESICRENKIAISCIGEITSKERGIRLISNDGIKKMISRTGYDHFKLKRGLPC